MIAGLHQSVVLGIGETRRKADREKLPHPSQKLRSPNYSYYFIVICCDFRVHSFPVDICKLLLNIRINVYHYTYKTTIGVL